MILENNPKNLESISTTVSTSKPLLVSMRLKWYKITPDLDQTVEIKLKTTEFKSLTHRRRIQFGSFFKTGLLAPKLVEAEQKLDNWFVLKDRITNLVLEILFKKCLVTYNLVHLLLEVIKHPKLKFYLWSSSPNLFLLDLKEKNPVSLKKETCKWRETTL